jgi:hypothetical protein
LSTEAAERNDEVARLRARVSALETELVEVRAWSERVITDAQARTYWLDRWPFDLNALMRRPTAHRIRAFARAVRAIYRRAMHMKWHYLS